MFDIKRSHRLFKEGFWIVTGQVMAVLGSLVGVRLMTELLDPAAYGELALGMTVATLVNQTILGPLGNGIIRFYAPAKEQDELSSYLKAAGQLIFWATGIILMLIFCTIVGLLFARQMNLIAITFTALLFAIVSGYNSILSGVQNAARRRSVVALHQGVESWLRFLFAAVLMMWLGATSATAMIGYILATILVLGSQYRFFRKIMPQNPVRVSNGEHWQKQIWTFSWPISSFGIFTWAQLASDRWALGLFSTMQEVGLYAVLFQLGYYPISLLSGMLIQFLAPIFYQRAGDASNKQRNANVAELSWRLTSITLLATSVTFLLALQFHTQIFRILVATEYARISHLLPWIMLAGGLFAAGQNIGLNLMSQLKTRAMMSVKIVTALLGVALNFIGAYWYGITGIVTANILFSLLFFFWMLALGKKQGG